MKNLHRVIPSLLTWMYEEGESYDEVKMRYMQMFVHWGRMTERVITAIGGSREELKHFGQEGPVYRALSREEQQRSMAFLDEHLFATPDRKSTRLNSSHVAISYAVFCLKKTNVYSY